ncbi:MAG: hypothetical protein RBG13Loki_3598 [Promethearchaeota archaeon CR_4]|nr:MAG: hypothetical protein RBG13Loki_3598 [Candidatus Lokiarchaeota archaeon CR_4]
MEEPPATDAGSIKATIKILPASPARAVLKRDFLEVKAPSGDGDQMTLQKEVKLATLSLESGVVKLERNPETRPEAGSPQIPSENALPPPEGISLVFGREKEEQVKSPHPEKPAKPPFFPRWDPRHVKFPPEEETNSLVGDKEAQRLRCFAEFWSLLPVATISLLRIIHKAGARINARSPLVQRASRKRRLKDASLVDTINTIAQQHLGRAIVHPRTRELVASVVSDLGEALTAWAKLSQKERREVTRPKRYIAQGIRIVSALSVLAPIGRRIG